MTISLPAVDRLPARPLRAVGLVSILVLAAIALPTAWLGSLALATREQLTPVIVPAALVLYWSFGLPGRWSVTVGLALTAALFLLPVLGLWLTGASNFAVAGGLMPWSDAGDYYYNAQRLLEGLPVTEFSARRMLFVGMLASLLEVTGRNLQVVLVMMVVFSAVACYSAASAVQRTHGRVAAVVLLLLLFLYYRRIAGTTLTENLGFPLGVLAFTLLWEAAGSRSSAYAVCGIVALTMGLNARTGAFFVLPTLIAWAVFRLGESRAPRWRTGVIAVLAVTACFVVTSTLIRVAGVPDAQAFSDFPYTFYGIAAGGKRWLQIYIDHPEIAGLSGREESREVMRLAWATLAAHPSWALVGTAKAFAEFVSLPGAFHFIDPLPAAFENVTYRGVLSALMAWSLWMVVRGRSDPHSSLLIAAMAGVLLSVPFIPPVDSDRLRVYAATVPLTAALVAVGASLMAARFSHGDRPKDLSRPNATLAGIGAAALLLLSGIGALVPWTPTAFPDEAKAACPEGLAKAVVRLDRGSTMQVFPDSEAKHTRIPVVNATDFQRQLDFQSSAAPSYLHTAQILSSQRFPAIMAYGPDLATGKRVWLTAGYRPELSQGGVARACGGFTLDSLVTERQLFTATAVQLHTPGPAR